MSGLPTQIPQQSVPITDDGKNPQYLDINWWLFFYNLSQQIFGSGSGSSGGGSTPASPYDALDAADLVAQTSDIPQAFRGLSNVQALLSMQSLPGGADIALVQRVIANIEARLSVQSLPDGADIAHVRRDLENLSARLGVQSQPDGADIARVRHDLANALMLAAVALLPDPTPSAQPVQSVTVGASPFTYTALFNGTLAVSAGTVSSISIIRQGVTVATGTTAGLIPMRRLDEVQITYTSAPTVVFLPD